MKYLKVIGKFVKAKSMGLTDEQATVITILATIVIIALAVN
jgi:hypothetical protein